MEERKFKEWVQISHSQQINDHIARTQEDDHS